MKKLFIVFIVTVFALTSRAQNISLGPIIGFGHAWISGLNGNKSWNSSYNIGASLIYSSAVHWGLGTDVKYSHEGIKTISKTNNEHVTTINSNYFRVPLKAYYFFGNYGDAVRPKIAAGPTFGFLSGGNTIVEENDHQLSKQKSKNILKGFDAGLQGSVGVNAKIASNTWLNADTTYYNGFTNISKEDNQNYRNRNLVINAGISFGLGTYK